MRALFGASASDDWKIPAIDEDTVARRSVLDEITSAPPADRYARLRAHVRTQVCAVLGLGANAAPEDGLGLSELGMDSLMATELRTRLQKSLGSPLPSTLAFEYPTISAMTSFLMTQLGLTVAPVVVAAAPTLDALDDLDDDDIARLLDDELNQAGF